MSHSRYALYYTCPPGALADRAAAWLGWDVARGMRVAHPALPDLPMPIADVTETPGKYGFHGTLKPPFRLAEGVTLNAFQNALAEFASRTPAFAVAQMEGAELGSFLALRPSSPCQPLSDFAAACVTEFDRFRAPLNDAELARRRAR